MTMDKPLARALGQIRRRSNEAKWLARQYETDEGMYASWEDDVRRTIRAASQLGATPQQIGRAGAFYPRRAA